MTYRCGVCGWTRTVPNGWEVIIHVYETRAGHTLCTHAVREVK